MGTQESPGRDLESELWSVYGRLGSLEDEKDRATLELKALELIAKIRTQGEKVKPERPKDLSLTAAREAVNGKVRA